MRMRDAWARQAPNWLELVRRQLDEGWKLSRPRFLDLVPRPGRLTLDVGCGEGRLARSLVAAGHRVIGVDVTELLARAASDHADPVTTVVADAAALPFPDQVADLVVSFMSLMDTDDYAIAVAEAGRVLSPGGRYCVALVHPLAESGRFVDDGSFLVDRPYLQTWRYPDELRRQGLEMTFHTEHRPIEAYSKALEDAGFVIEAIREPMPDAETAEADPHEARWRRIPNFLLLRARKDPEPGRRGSG
jgi:ubiquinone/menaquinone biosynthesis C-methylase UbiE